VANYNVDIAVAVKNTQAVTQLSNSINQTGTRVDRLNEILEKFGDNIGGTLVNSVRSFSDATREAALNLNKVALGSKDAAKAAREFVQAVDLENAALREQAALIAQVRNEGKSGTLRPAQQYSGPIGPGPASSTALSSPLPARSARTTQYLSPIGPVSPQERTGRVEQLARETALRSAANQKDFDARRTFQTELFNIEKRFENSLERQRREADSDEFDRLLKRLNTEQNKIKEIGDLRAKINQKEIEDFDKRFKQARDLRGQTSPIGGAVGIPGSPAAKAAAAKKGGGNKLSDLALGVGFPLLFGGGAGSVAGGALGSVGGMGGQVLGSAIGAIVDTFVAGIGDIGKALNPLTADIDALASSAGIAGTENGKLIQSLESFVSSEKALELASQQLAVTVGEDGVKALKDYGQANTELSNEFSKAFADLAAAAAPFLEKVTRAISSRVETVRLVKRGVNEFGSDPTVQAAQAKFRQGKLNESQLEQQIAEFVRKKEESAQKAADLQLQSTSGSRISLQIAEQDLIVAKAKNNLLDERAQKAEKNKIALQFSKDTQDILLLQDEKRITNAEAQRRLEKAGIANDIAKLNLADRITKAKEDEAKAAERQAKAAERRATAEAKRIQRELDARAKGITSAEIGAGQSFIARGRADLERTAVFDGEEAALNQKLKLILQERDIKLEILDAQYKQKNLQAKSLEEQRLLYDAYLDQYAVIVTTAEVDNRRTQNLQEQLALAEQVSALSAAAGFDVLSLAGNTNAVQDRGIYGADTGPVSFEEGINLAPLIAYQVELDKILEKYPLIGEAAGAAAGLITTGFESIIDGTKSAEEVFADFLNNIADMLMKTAQQMIAQYIAIAIAKMFAGMGPGSSFSDFAGSITGGNPFAAGGKLDFFPTVSQFADGGRPPVGRPSIVGERGPELFVPGASGTIIPNEAMGGTNVVVNVDASGSNAQGDGQQAKQLGAAIGAAVQAELVRQKRPGGILG